MLPRPEGTASPIELKSASRIERLACCGFIALLCQCLIERELRAVMTRNKVKELAQVRNES